jgi:hypothetical protein
MLPSPAHEFGANEARLDVAVLRVDPVQFAFERDDILKRKKDKLIIFNSVHELLDCIAKRYSVSIRI